MLSLLILYQSSDTIDYNSKNHKTDITQQLIDI